MLTISGKSVFGAIIGSVIISAVIMGGFIFFVLPMIFPSVEERNIVIQTKYGEWNTESYIYDDELTWTKMTDTELDITVQENSQIYATFSAMALLWLVPAFGIRNSYLVSLVVEGLMNQTFMVMYYDGNPSYPHYRELTYNLYMNLVTPNLPAGTYTVAVYWKSTFDATGDNGLSVAHDPTFNYTRTMFLEELITS